MAHFGKSPLEELEYLIEIDKVRGTARRYPIMGAGEIPPCEECERDAWIVLDAGHLRMAERAMEEILEEIATGRIPVTVNDFGELHDYIDANELGGLCEDEYFSRFDTKSGDSFMSDAQMDQINGMSNYVCKWIRSGLHRDADKIHDAIKRLEVKG